MAHWHFAEQLRDDVDDETTVSKNFERESRRRIGIFIREFFQNVLDAPLTLANGAGPIIPHVRIAIYGPENGLSVEALSTLLDGLHDHLKPAGHDPLLWGEDQTNVLVLEEFDTSGLIGDAKNSRAKGENENWANFWFGEGKRTKLGSSLGRAGQGKITYHLISGVQTVFALTRRQGEDSDLLFGKCIVQRTHVLGGKDYKRHGYWPRIGEANQPLPTDDFSDLAEFKSICQLKRQNESGTSWVIPFVDSETFSEDRIIAEILRDFFFSIIAGTLTVEVMGTLINQSNLSDVVAKFPIKDLPVGFMDFLEEVLTLPDNDESIIQAADGWYGSSKETPISEDAFDEGHLEAMRVALDSQQLIAVRLPVPIVPTNGDPVTSSILVYLKKPDQLSRTEEIYVRSGLVIGEERHLRKAPGRFFGLMWVDDPHISEFLAFAEEASHMRWNASETEVTSRYKNVSHTIARVRYALPKLAKLLLGHTSGRHDDALIDFLSIPAPSNAGRKAKTTKRRGKSGGDEGGGTKVHSITRFRVAQTGTQWTLTPGPGAAELVYPLQIRIDLAYATMPGEGNPFKVYHRFEFDLGDESVHVVATQNAILLSRDLNRLEVELSDPDFSLSVDGFSEHALKSRIVGVDV